MAATAIPGLDVTEEWPLANRQQPNWTDPSGRMQGAPRGGPLVTTTQPPPTPGTALVDPKRPNFTTPRARQPYDFDMSTAGAGANDAGRVGGLRGAAYRMGRLLAPIAPYARAAGRIGGVGLAAEGLSHVGDYSIDDPDATGFQKAGRDALGAIMDTGSAVASLADTFIPGDRPASFAYNRFLRSQFGPLLKDNTDVGAGAGAWRGFVNPPTGGAPAALTAATAPNSNPTDQRLAAGLQRPPSALPYIRNGNSFTDAGGGIQDGLRIGVTPGMTDEAYAREARAREINGQMAETQKQLDNATAPTPGMTGFRASRLADPSGSSILGPSGGGIMRPRDVRHAQDVALQRELAGLRERGEMERAQLGANTTMSAAQLGAQTQRDINERNVALGLRGQDMTLAGHRMANDVARAQMMRQMYESDRSFAAGRDDANFTQGEAAQKALHEQIANMLPPITVDGKPAADTATAARYMGSLNSLVGNRMELLKQHLRLNPNDQQAASELAGLRRRGVANIPQDQVHRLIVGQRLADIAASTHTGSFTPWGSTAVSSSKPVEWFKDDGRGNYVTDRGDVIPKRYVDKEGSTFGFGGKQQLDFRVLDQTPRSLR